MAKPKPMKVEISTVKSKANPVTQKATSVSHDDRKAAKPNVSSNPEVKTGNLMSKSKPSNLNDTFRPPEVGDPAADAKLSPFLRKQKEKLLALRDGMLDSMAGVAKDNLRARAEGSEASAFGLHQADAGSDAYDRDFALSLLSQEQDALYEIEEALKRLDAGTYGVCEMSGKAIPHARLEAIPFARLTVECQSQIEKQKKATRVRQPVTSLFGLSEDEGGSDNDEEESPSDLKE